MKIDDSCSLILSEEETSVVHEIAEHTCHEDETSVVHEHEHDDLQEVKKLSQKETNFIRVWRVIVTLTMLAAGTAVTLTAYEFLEAEQVENFESAFEKFAKTLADAAIEQQLRMRNSLNTLSDSISDMVAATPGAAWPFVSVPMFENHAQNLRRSAGNLESTVFIQVVKEEDEVSYIDWTIDNYEDVQLEAHTLAFGTSAGLDTNTSKFNTGAFYWPYPDDTTYRPGRMPTWQFSPPFATYSGMTFNTRANPRYDQLMTPMFLLKNETLLMAVGPYSLEVPGHDKMHSNRKGSSPDHPHSFYAHPIRRSSRDQHSEVVGCLIGGLALDASLLNLLPSNVVGLVAVISNTCNQTYTYALEGKDAFYAGEGDLHEREFDDMGVFVVLSQFDQAKATILPGHCVYSMGIYPTERFRSSYNSNLPETFALCVALTFLFMATTFFIYDLCVQRRNQKVLWSAARSSAVVSSLFPSTVRDRLYEHAATDRAAKTRRGAGCHLSTFVAEGDGVVNDFSSPPIADLFLETTVMFADIVGFTAWSSVRSPCQVFSLLESVFGAYDRLAQRRRIFKVETVGDCYVAVAGLPEARKDHSVAMARFARECVCITQHVTRQLELKLGPDTSELTIRIGMHSGPVTAGVLRGDRSRFQLFGDTVNTTARIETTGDAGKIHISQSTADNLIKSGKRNWIVSRPELVKAKGKGDMQTYWLKLDSETECRPDKGDAQDLLVSGICEMQGIEEIDLSDHYSGLEEKTKLLIEWNVKQLVRLLKLIVARRQATTVAATEEKQVKSPIDIATGGYLEEVQEIIVLPEFDSRIVGSEESDLDKITLPEKVVSELRQYVACIAKMYKKNPFHNFEHASHVTMSVLKLLSRIVGRCDLDFEGGGGKRCAATLHDCSYGITSDPLTQFACALSALMHDADHQGVPNNLLSLENPSLSAKYKGRSVAEQNSLDLTWNCLMTKQFQHLRATLFSSDSDLRRFRHLVVNSIMATDIMDDGLKERRNARWDRAFNKADQVGLELLPDTVNRKATIVIEHLIQASDVSHTMQHWHIYLKWNLKLLEEMYLAFTEGRSQIDPTLGWYKGEIGFFDFYIIPLAKKLKECGVFGKSSDEYLNYALKNRQEWELQGQEVVAEMVEKVKSKYSESKK